VSFAAFLLAVAPAAAPFELAPSGKWQVEYAKSSCIVSRAFGEGAQKLIFALKPAPYSDVVSIIIIQPAAKARGIRGKAEVKLSGGHVPESSDFTSVSANGMRVTTIELSRPALDAFAKGDSIAIRAGDRANVALRPSGFDKVRKAFDECEADLLESWGFSRAAQAAVAQYPKGNLAGLFSADDYPTQAIENHESGSVGIRMRVEPDGTLSECAVIESSGSAALDRTTCAVARKRARYAPALGKDGKPIWSFTFGRVT
jgi:TonB family protein